MARKVCPKCHIRARDQAATVCHVCGTTLPTLTPRRGFWAGFLETLLGSGGPASTAGTGRPPAGAHPDIAVTPLPPKQLAQVSRQAITDSMSAFGNWWAGKPDALVRDFKATVERGLMEGLSIDKTARLFRDTPGFREANRGGIHIDAKVLVWTAMNAVPTAITIEESKSHDFVGGWQLFTTFDAKTCAVCAALSGGAFDFKGNPLPQSRVRMRAPQPRPPLHPTCRCSTIPVVEGEALVEDGYFIDWLEKEVAYQREVVENMCGAERLALFRDGRISLRDAINESARELMPRLNDVSSFFDMPALGCDCPQCEAAIDAADAEKEAKKAAKRKKPRAKQPPPA